MGSSLPAQIARSIVVDFIENGLVGAGGRLPSVRDLKDRYLTTNTTICSSLNILESQGYVTKIHGKGIYVREDLETGQTSRPKLIGVNLGQPADSASMVTRLYMGMERVARSMGYQIIYAHHLDNYETEREDVSRFRDSGCQGAIIHPAHRLRSQLRNDYLTHEYRDFPIVLVDICYPEQKRTMVVPDNYRSGFEVASYLISKGQRRIAFMDWKAPKGDVMSRSVGDRYAGYLAALKAAQIRPRPEDHWRVTFPTFSLLSMEEPLMESQQCIQGLLDIPAEQRPTALMALNDEYAVRIIKFAQECGINVPGDLEVTGFDNNPMITEMGYTFATTDPQFDRIGETAVQVLARLIGGEITDGMQYVLPAPLYLRELPLTS